MLARAIAPRLGLRAARGARAYYVLEKTLDTYLL